MQVPKDRPAKPVLKAHRVKPALKARRAKRVRPDHKANLAEVSCGKTPSET